MRDSQKQKFILRNVSHIHLSGLHYYKESPHNWYPYPTHAPSDVLAHPQAVSRAMATPQEKVAIVVCLAKLKSVAAVQSCSGIKYRRELPTRKNITFWNNKLRIPRNLLLDRAPGEPRPSEEDVKRIRKAFRRCPRKSIRADSNQLQFPLSTVRCALHKHLQELYQIQVLLELKSSDALATAAYKML